MKEEYNYYLYPYTNTYSFNATDGFCKLLIFTTSNLITAMKSINTLKNLSSSIAYKLSTHCLLSFRFNPIFVPFTQAQQHNSYKLLNEL